MRKIIITAVPIALAIMLSGCGQNNSSSETQDTSSVSAADSKAKPVSNRFLDPLILVNNENPVPDNWENDVPLVMTNNSQGEGIAVEKKAYQAYLELKYALESDGVYIDISSAYRSFNELNNAIITLAQQYGDDYAKQTIGQPGFSEDQTGLAINLYLNIGGVDITDTEALANETDTWAKVHEKLPEYGFILRYPEGKEEVTGHSYQPWHIRYVGSPETAQDITDKGIALEEYDDAVKTN